MSRWGAMMDWLGERALAAQAVESLDCPECGRNTNYDGNGHICHGSRELARINVLEYESADLRKKLQETEDRAIRAEVALESMHAAMTKIASCPCRVSDTDCGMCVSCIARAALGVEASNERMINRENFKYWKKP